MRVSGKATGARLLSTIPGPLGFDLDAAGFTGKVVAEAAPRPVFWLLHQTALHGIAVHVAELFDVLAMGEGVEVVVAGLPELRAVPFELF